MNGEWHLYFVWRDRFPLKIHHPCHAAFDLLILDYKIFALGVERGEQVINVFDFPLMEKGE